MTSFYNEDPETYHGEILSPERHVLKPDVSESEGVDKIIQGTLGRLTPIEVFTKTSPYKERLDAERRKNQQIAAERNKKAKITIISVTAAAAIGLAVLHGAAAYVRINQGTPSAHGGWFAAFRGDTNLWEPIRDDLATLLLSQREVTAPPPIIIDDRRPSKHTAPQTLPAYRN